MAGFAGMDEEGRGAGRGEGGGDFAADMSGFAHAGNDNAALGVLHDVQRLAEGVVKFAFHHAEGFDFFVNRSFCGSYVFIFHLKKSLFLGSE